LVNSLLAFTATWSSLEGLAVAAKAGINLRPMIEVIRTGGAGNFFTERMVEGINERGRPTQFALALAAKDAGLLLEVAREAGVPVAVAAEVARALVAAVEAGLGERDFTDLVELIERQAGVALRNDCVLFVPRSAIWTSAGTYLEPDLFLVSTERLREMGEGPRTTADLVVEISSPGSAVYDRTAKADTYAALGVRELWLVDL